MFDIYPSSVKSQRLATIRNRAQSVIEQDNAFFTENAKKVSSADLIIEIAANRVNYEKGLAARA